MSRRQRRPMRSPYFSPWFICWCATTAILLGVMSAVFL